MTYHTAATYRGFAFVLDRVPKGLPTQLKRDGLAAAVARTPDGILVDPARDLALVIHAVERSGAEIRAIQRDTEPGAWRRSVRPVQSAGERLRNPRSACWLPTLPPVAA